MPVLIDIFQSSGSRKPKRKRGSKKKMEGHTNIALLKSNGEPTAPKGVDRMVNQCGDFFGKTSPLATNYGRKIKSLIMMQTPSSTRRRKCYRER
jgi:hypothetical protein